MTERKVLDEWAAKFLDEDLAGVADAVSSEWYTSSPGAAFVVLNKAASEGKKVKIEIEGGEADVYCGDEEVEGSVDQLAELIIAACYACYNG